jgi:rhamnosyl/mannosyltransferase
MGGIPEAIALIVDGMKSNKHSSILVCRYKGPHRHLVVDGIPIEAVGSLGTICSSPLSLTYPFILKQRAQKADLVALHLPFPLSNIGVTFGIPKHVALVVHWHCEIVDRAGLVPFFAPFVHRTLARAQRIIVSDQTLIHSSHFLAPYADKCVVIPYGINTNYWHELPDRARSDVCLLKEKYPRLIITTGRLVPYKGHAVLIRALKEINATMVIVGDGPLRNSLIELGKTLRVSERIIFAGNVPSDELRTYLHAAKLFVLPSITIAEAFGLAQVEGMAAGLPIVNTALPTGVPRIARDMLEGLTVPPGNHLALANAIEQLLDNPNLARRLGIAASTRARTHFDVRRFSADVEKIYDEAVLHATRLTSRC